MLKRRLLAPADARMLSWIRKKPVNWVYQFSAVAVWPKHVSDWEMEMAPLLWVVWLHWITVSQIYMRCVAASWVIVLPP